MTRDEAFEKTKHEIVGENLIISSVDDAEKLHELFIKLRGELFRRQIVEIMPHYRGEQKYGWDIRSGIFRPPLNIENPQVGKDLEKRAIQEFEKTIVEKIGSKVLRDIFYNKKYGKDWDLLFQAQHAGVKTTLTDWTAEIISALYFSTEKSEDNSINDSDGQIWCLIMPIDLILGHGQNQSSKSFYELNPFEMNGTYVINPSSYFDDIENRIFEYRMFKQKGRFVVSSNDTCNIPLNKHSGIAKYFFQIKIPAKFKQNIREELAERKVNRAYMYYDEDPDGQNLITEINKTIFG